jgi:hypothetical protein
MRRMLLLLPVLLFMTGCIPVLAGTLIVKSSRTKGQKQEFIAQLHKVNSEREINGLQPLDWCSEAYRFDKGWAQGDPNCAKRIAAYEAGDASALAPTAMPGRIPTVTDAPADSSKQPSVP